MPRRSSWGWCAIYHCRILGRAETSGYIQKSSTRGKRTKYATGEGSVVEENTIWTCYDDILSIYGITCSTIRDHRLVAAIKGFWRPPIHECLCFRQCGLSRRAINRSGPQTTCPDHQERHDASSGASVPACLQPRGIHLGRVWTDTRPGNQEPDRIQWIFFL